MISYIIVSYNTVDLTIQTIRSIIENCVDYEVIVIDNDSCDGTVESLRKIFGNYTNIHVINSGSNLGFSKANNIGAKIAKGDFFVFVNPDTVFIDDIGTKLLQMYRSKFKNKEVILSPQILNPDYTEQHCMNLFPVLSVRTLIGKMQKTISYGNIRKSDWITGVSLSMSRETYEKLKGWNEIFDLYSEDLDICYRLRKMGGRSYVIKNIKLIHYGNQSGKQVYKTTYESERKKLNSLRVFYQQYYDDSKFLTYLRVIKILFKNTNIEHYINEELRGS